MAFPSLTYEIDWDRDGVWTDVTPYLLSFRVRRGRQHELGRTEPGRGTVTFRNEDRRFDPTHTGSPYAPNVIPTRPIRIRASKGGKLGAALSFDGTNDRVDVAHASVFNLTGDLTIEAWVKPAAFGASHRMLVTKVNGGNSATATFEWRLRPTDGVPEFLQGDGTASSNVAATSAPILNEWTHLAIVKSGTTVTHYLGGVVNGSGTGSATVTTHTRPVIFAGRDDGFGYLSGLLDDIRIWNVARSQADIARDMDRELTGTESGLVGYWKLNGSGTTATDSTANANHGTLNGPTWVDSAYDIFRGFTGGWNPTYPEFGRSTVVLEVFDALALFNLAELRNPYVMEVLADSPRAYYRLNETGGTTAADASGNRRNGTYSGGPIFSQSDPITDDVNGAVSFDGVNDIVALPDAAALSGTAVSLELWIKHGVVPEESNNKWPLAQFLNGVTTSGTRFELVRSGANIGKIAWLIDQANILISTGRVDDNAWHHIVGTYDGTTMRLYVDGAQVATLAVTTTVTARSIAIGGWPGDPGSVHAWDALVDEVALYSTTLSAARVSAHYDARNAWLNDTTGQRIGRVLDRIGWAAGDRNIDTGDTSLSSAPEMDGETALAHLTKIAHTEAGLLWITGAGVVRFVSRRNLLRSPYNVSQATFGDGDGELPYVELLPEQDEQEIYNVARVTRQGGITAVARAAQADIDRYGGERVLAETIHANTDREAQDRADWDVVHSKDAQVRFRRKKVRAHAGSTDALWTQILSRDLGDRLTVVRRPPGGGAAMSQQVRLNALEHALVGQQWETTYELAPAGADYWIWDTSIWDTSTRWAY